MARTSARTSDGALAQTATAARFQGFEESSALKYVPGFVYILVLYIAGKFIFADPRATLIQWGEYQLSWVEVLMVGAAMVAMAEQLRVSHPGIDNTIEAILIAQLRLFRCCFSLSAQPASDPSASSTAPSFSC